MRWLPALAAVTFVACRGDSGSLEGELQRTEQLLRNEQFGTVRGEIDGLLLRAAKRRDLRAEWQFRLDKAEALLGLGSAPKEVLTVLVSQGDMPGGDEWAADRARWLILRARVASGPGQAQDAQKLLDEAAFAARRANRQDIAAEVELRHAFPLTAEGKVPAAEQECPRRGTSVGRQVSRIEGRKYIGRCAAEPVSL